MTTSTPRPQNAGATGSLTTREAVPEEREEIIEMFLTAFADEAAMTWVLPDPRTRGTAMHEMFHESLSAAIDAGSMILAIDPAGTAMAASMWRPRAGVTAADAVGEASETDASGTAGAASDDPCDHDRMSARLRMMHEATAARQPTLDHLHLDSMAVLPAHRSQGAGSALIRAGLARADQLDLPVHLEASTPGSRALYHRHGFRAHGEPIHLPDGGPTLYPMWRER